jgi:hypothetical protein
MLEEGGLVRQVAVLNKVFIFLKGAAMKTFLAAMVGVWVVMLMGCGVSREAGALATAEAAVGVPGTDAAIRMQLVAEDAQWAQLAQLLQQREFGGISVDAAFVNLVSQTAALAKRQHELIDQNLDTADTNRQALQSFQQLWQSTSKYLNP